MLTVQFDHRMLAYLVFLAAMVHAIDAWRAQRAVAGALILAGAVTLQALLGIVTLLNQAQIELALAHQMAAILVFTVAVVHAERLCHRGGLVLAKTTGSRR
jgi:cytochrome c oxidase assembly protein subunit 15